MTSPLIRYEDAKRQLAEMTHIEEVKAFRDKAEAIEHYAYRARDPELAAYAADVKTAALRKLGELMAEQRAVGKMAKPPGVSKDRVSKKPDVPSLASQGVDKNLAHQARRLAALTEEEFEAAAAEKRELAVAAVTGKKEVVAAARKKRAAEKRKRREAREHELAEKITALPESKFGVIYADPEWRFEFWSESGKDIGSPDNHYPTSSLDEIKNRPVASIAADDCVLFMWATAPMLPQALQVMEAWGFAYKTQAVWIKDRRGIGFWFFGQHELLLVGTRGKIPAPAPGDQWSSVIEAPRGRHSEKPEKAIELIEAYFPHLPKIELNRRGPARPGWAAWGNESLP